MSGLFVLAQKASDMKFATTKRGNSGENLGKERHSGKTAKSSKAEVRFYCYNYYKNSHCGNRKGGGAYVDINRSARLPKERCGKF